MGQGWNLQVGKIIPAGYSPYTKTAQNVYDQYQRVLAIHKNAPKRVRSVPSKRKRKQNSICRSVFLVDYGEKLSNYMFGLQVLQTFSESIKEENASDSLI